MSDLPGLIGESLDRCSANSKGRSLLVLQDSTEFNYTHLGGKLRINDPDIGTLDNPSQTGFFLHPCLVLDRAQETPLGYSSISFAHRPFDQANKKARKYGSLPIKEKESYKWIESAQSSKQTLAEAEHLLLISDRESDIYQYLSSIPDHRTDVLIRVRHDRALSDQNDHRLFSQLSQAPLLGGMYLKIKDNPKRQNRLAKLLVRAQKVSIKRPPSVNKELAPAISMWALEIKEIEPSVPQDEAPIHWRLLCSESCQSLEKALQIAHLYSLRWWIEQLFRTLKRKGLKVESAQLSKGLRLKKMVVMALQVALPIMTMVQDRENSLGIEAQRFFSPDQIQFLYALVLSLEGKTRKQQNPYPPKSLAWAFWAIARLGGWKGYAAAGLPGIVSCIRGYKEFSALFRGWEIAQKNLPP